MTDTAIELEKLYFSTPAPALLRPPFCPIPCLSPRCRRGCCHHSSHPTRCIFLQLTGWGCLRVLRPPTTSEPPPVPGTHPFPSPLLLDGQAHLQDREERRTWQACRTGDVNPPEKLTHTPTNTRSRALSHMVYIERYRDSISCQIEMGIKEEAGNYLRALSKRCVTDRRCEQRMGQRGGGWYSHSCLSVRLKGGVSSPRSLFW